MTYSEAKRLLKMTPEQRSLLYSKLYNNIASYGGTCYGLDWRTTRIRFPKHCAYMQTILKLDVRGL